MTLKRITLTTDPTTGATTIEGPELALLVEAVAAEVVAQLEAERFYELLGRTVAESDGALSLERILAEAKEVIGRIPVRAPDPPLASHTEGTR